LQILNVRPEPIDRIAFSAVEQPCLVAALQGASNAAIQALLADFARRAARRGYRIAGVVEVENGKTGGGCGRRAVCDLASGTVVSISQNLGRGSTACNLDPSGLIEACTAVERSIAAGADLVVLSKFGKLEADRGGLSGAFRSAIDAGLPVLTAVSPAMTTAWTRFAGSLSQFIAADAKAVDEWWAGVRSEMLLLQSV